MSAQVKKIAPTVNLHLVKPCNMKCGFCFAHFYDAQTKMHLSELQLKQLIDIFHDNGFRKFTFVGGEPLLCAFLPELIRYAKTKGPDVVTMVVTNGSLLDKPYNDSMPEETPLKRMAPWLDWLTISIDSILPETNAQIGRKVNGSSFAPPDLAYYLDLFNKARLEGIPKFKINTVVNAFNWQEDLSQLIRHVRPERWKLFQALRIEGENEKTFHHFEISPEQFDYFVDRHHESVGSLTRIIPEANDDMIDSYIIVDPDGCFNGNSNNIKTKSQPILDVGLEAAFKQINFDLEKFRRRGGSDYFNQRA